MPLIGTAGHVDHGKSTLIQQITGRDPDRWDEEKERGLTIDLGFAWTTLPGGTEVSFVDVPGHERYLKNMLAGIEAIDLALLVVAADEGWMPQSEEHLAVLDLLGVDLGVVALTKIDAVDPELADLARAEITDQLAGSSLEGAPIVDVSAVTGKGVDKLVAELASMIAPDEEVGARPRMWVDRSFTISGAGTVVTGSLLGGSLSVDDVVEIHPHSLSGRVRSLQSHEQSHDQVGPGRRVAVNLAGVDHDQIARGDMLGLAGQWDLSNRFTASLSPARYAEEASARGDYQIHLGSSAHRADLVALEGRVAVINIDGQVPMMVGDRFILRDTGRHLVVGGGRVLDPGPGRTRRALEASSNIDPEAPVDAIASSLLSIRRIDSLHRLEAHSGGGTPTGGIVVGERAVDPSLMDELTANALRLVSEEHTRHPLREGLPVATLAERLRVDPDIAEVVVDRSEDLERRGPNIANRDHRAGLTDQQDTAWQGARSRLAESLAVPDETDLGLDPEVLHLKIRTGELIRVGPGLVYLPDQVEELKTTISKLGEGFTVAQFRDAASLSRKYAVPILEWSDKEGLTVRRGDTRNVR